MYINSWCCVWCWALAFCCCLPVEGNARWTIRPGRVSYQFLVNQLACVYGGMNWAIFIISTGLYQDFVFLHVGRVNMLLIGCVYMYLKWLAYLEKPVWQKSGKCVRAAWWSCLLMNLKVHKPVCKIGSWVCSSAQCEDLTLFPNVHLCHHLMVHVDQTYTFHRLL